MSEPPSGTVTLLFTDVEGSTRLLQRAGDAYAGLLADHRRLLREAFARHRGFEMDSEGDAFFAAFESANDAVAAAADAQAALAQHDWPDGNEVRVRMGLHTGEPRAVGGRYVGLVVHAAARPRRAPAQGSPRHAAALPAAGRRAAGRLSAAEDARPPSDQPAARAERVHRPDARAEGSVGAADPGGRATADPHGNRRRRQD